MENKRRQSAREIMPLLSIVLAGALAGMILGGWLGRFTAVNQAKGSLSRYAEQLIERGDLVFDELDSIAQQVDRSKLSFCSDAELAHLRALTFGSYYLKDIGRTSEGKLYCSAFLGRLATPYVEGEPTLRLSDSTRIFSNVDIVLASSDQGQGTVVEHGTINVVLAPSLFRPPAGNTVNYQVFGRDLPTQRFAALAGSSVPFKADLFLTPGFQLTAGVLYHSACSSRRDLCTLVSAPLSVLTRPARGAVVAYTVAGGLTGLSVALLLTLWMARYKRLGPKLRRALRRRSAEISLLYQPILDLNSQRYVGAEALMRWTDSKGRAVPPDTFVAVAEREGFINDLTAFVVERAIGEMGEHLRANREFTLSLNIAAVDLGNEAFFTLLQSEVKRANISPSQIALELTERSTSDLDSICAAIQRLRKIGFKVHIDDFGTGFSSLSYLDRLDVDAIKIDRAFTRTIGTGAVTSSIIPQMLAMASNLRLEVIVEGVESQAQSNFLAAADQGLRAQGWHFGRPMPAAAFFDLKPTRQTGATSSKRHIACLAGEGQGIVGRNQERFSEMNEPLVAGR